MTNRDLPLLVLVTGPPGAGKSTLAGPLARELGLPLLAKDAIKEALADALGSSRPGTDDRQWSRELGAATFQVLYRVLEELLTARASVVVDANFGRTSKPDLDALPPARVVQVHCEAPPEEIRRRYGGRADRHPIHYDGDKLDDVVARAASGEWDALELRARLLVVDTVRTSPDPASVAARILAW